MGKKEKALQVLDDLIEKTEKLEYNDSIIKDYIEVCYKSIVKEINLEVLNEYSQKISRIRYTPMIYTESTTKEDFKEWWIIGRNHLKDLLIATKKIYEVFDHGTMNEDKDRNELNIDNCKIFIAHGHDKYFMKDVELFLQKNQVETIILEDMPSEGKTIIEKLERHSNVKCTIILLSPEDKVQVGDKTVYRARQNVIWEFGFFAGYLSRAKVIAIKNDLNNANEKVDIELPSNIHGVVWIQYVQDNPEWKIKLSKELKEIGYEIDPGK